MKSKLSTILPGLFLILAGVIAFWAQLGNLNNNAPQFWIMVFAGFGLLSLVAYLLSGVRAWGWLFPTLICSAVALTIYLAEVGATGSLIGTPILVAIGLPFIVPLVMDVRKNWWALIPLWIMGMLAGVVALADRVQGEWIAALIMLGFAIPFLIVFLTDHSRWWALIPAGIMFSIGLMIILIGVFGSTTSIGSIGVGVMFLGFAATFGLLWFRRDYPVDWAKYPAIVLTVLAVFMFFSAASLNYAWPIILIAGGLLLLYFGFRRKSTDIKM